MEQRKKMNKLIKEFNKIRLIVSNAKILSIKDKSDIWEISNKAIKQHEEEVVSQVGMSIDEMVVEIIMLRQSKSILTKKVKRLQTDLAIARLEVRKLNKQYARNKI